MSTYLLRRLLQTLAFTGITMIALFTVIVYAMPEGPNIEYSSLKTEAASFPDAATPDPSNPALDPKSQGVVNRIRDLERRYKLDRVWPLSFFAWLFDPKETTEINASFDEVPTGLDITLGDLHIQGSGILTGNLGRSESKRLGKHPVSSLLGERWGATVLLICASLIVAVLVAAPIGIITSTRRGTPLERLLSFLSFAGLAVPSFVIALLLITVFALFPKQLSNNFGWTWLPFLPSGNTTSLDRDDLPNRIYHLVLPVMTLGIAQGLWLSRYIRASMLDTLAQDYVRTAWAKGLPRRQVVFKHALRNALVPVTTMLALLIPGMISAEMVVERAFSYAGMGMLFFNAFGGCIDPTHDRFCPDYNYIPDYPVALALVLILVAVVALSNLLADVVYVMVDPRIGREGV